MLFFLVNEGPQFVQLTFVQMQVAKEVTHELITMLTQMRQPATDRIFVNVKKPAGGTNGSAFRQMPRTALIDGFIGANPSIRGAESGADEMITLNASETPRTIVSIMKVQPCLSTDESKAGALHISTVARISFHGCSHLLGR